MFPWFWIWNPQVHWPLSGSVTQDIEPSLDWFFQAIPDRAGKGQLEQQIFEEFSYGKQLGIILALLKPLVEQGKLATIDDAELQEHLSSFQRLNEEIENQKTKQASLLRQQAAKALEDLAACDPAAYQQLVLQAAGKV